MSARWGHIRGRDILSGRVDLNRRTVERGGWLEGLPSRDPAEREQWRDDPLPHEQRAMDGDERRAA